MTRDALDGQAREIADADETLREAARLFRDLSAALAAYRHDMQVRLPPDDRIPESDN